MINDVMTVKEAAERYGLKENTVQLWCKGQKSLPPRLRRDEYCKSGGTWLVTRQGIERLTNYSWFDNAKCLDD